MTPDERVDVRTDTSFSQVFAHALQGSPCVVLGLGDTHDLPMGDWVRRADAEDQLLLGLCQGPTIDVGCGPGRLTAALADRGTLVLGIDVVPEAVDQTRARGGAALHRDVFEPLPGEGRWETALLADGNIGIGGDPVALLRRLREFLDPRGRIVAEVQGPGVAMTTAWASLECGGARSRPFRWSVVGLDDVASVAHRAGLAVSETHRIGGRWAVVLGEPGRLVAPGQSGQSSQSSQSSQENPC